eukprot:g70152.t1
MIGFLKDWCKVANGGLCHVSTRFGRLGGLRQNMKWSSTSPFCPKMKVKICCCDVSSKSLTRPFRLLSTDLGKKDLL